MELLTPPSETCVALPAHRLHAGTCVWCGDTPTGETYEEYVASWYATEYEGEQFADDGGRIEYGPDERAVWEYLRASCLGTPETGEYPETERRTFDRSKRVYLVRSETVTPREGRYCEDVVLSTRYLVTQPFPFLPDTVRDYGSDGYAARCAVFAHNAELED